MCVGGCNHSNRKSGEKSCYMVFVTASCLSLLLSVSFSLCPSVVLSLCLFFLISCSVWRVCLFYFVACCPCQRCINCIKSAWPLKGVLPCTRCYPWVAAAAVTVRVTVIVIVTVSITGAVGALTVALVPFAALVVAGLVHLFIAVRQCSLYAYSLRFNYAPNSSCSRCSTSFHCDSYSDSGSESSRL